MRDALMLLAAQAANVAGLAWLALAMPAHWEQVCGRSACHPRAARLLRAVGAGALAVSLLLCMAVDHPSMASLVWVMSLAAAALAVAFTLAWRPHWLRVLVRLSRG